MEAENKLISLLKPASGGGGGEEVNYADVTHKPQVNGNTLVGNKTSEQLGLVGDVQVNGTSVTTSGVANIPIATSDSLGVVIPKNGLQVTAQGNLNVNRATDGQIDARTNSYNPIVPVNLDYAVRSVKPACTTLSGTTATITANTTYAHAVGSSGCVYTINTPTDTSTVYNGFVLLIDTTNSASIAFQTDTTPAVTISISGNPTIELNKKYTVTGQFNPLSSTWELFIISYDV